MNFRVGFGYDMHRLVEGRDLWLGGIKINHEKGLYGHSDADVLIHTICDALLGAANLRDIGFHFPDTADEYHDVDSKILLKQVMGLLRGNGYEVSNIDSTIVAQAPKLAAHIPEMRSRIARALGIDFNQISVKATTEERLGFTGSGEGIAAQAIALIEN